MTSCSPSEFRAIDAIAVAVTIVLLFLLLALALPRSMPGHEQAIVGGLAVVAGVFAGVLMRRKALRSVLAPGRFSPGLVFWTMFGTAGISLAIYSLQQPILDFFPDSKPELDRLEREISEYPTGVLIFLVAVMAPVTEELLFRGVLLKGFRSSWGVLAGLFLSSALFGLIHGIAPRVVITFFIGWWLGSLFLRSGGLALPILAHACHNGFVVILGLSGLLELSSYYAIPGAAAFLLAGWRLFRSRAGSVQGSAPSGPS